MSSPRGRAGRAGRLLGVAVLVLVVLGTGSAPAGTAAEPWIDTADRDQVLAEYRAEFGADVPAIGWDGGRQACDAGTSSRRFRQATLDRVNYYRAMAGVAATVTEQVGFSGKAQQAAMMMSAQGELTHEPASGFACFTADGREAASKSNLYLGRTGPAAVDGYIEDPGQDNTDVGHRSTILHPPTLQMGVGDVGRWADGEPANALWVFDQRVFDEDSVERRPAMREPDRFVAWPPRGYVPAALVHPRWSFTLAGADFSRAEVVMFRPWARATEQRVPLEVIDRTGAPGHVPLPTIVWEPEIEPPAGADELYVVVVRGVAGWSSQETVTIASGDGTGSARVGSRLPEREFVYEVRILGDRPGPQLTPAELLNGIGPGSAAAG